MSEQKFVVGTSIGIHRYSFKQYLPTYIHHSYESSKFCFLKLSSRYSVF